MPVSSQPRRGGGIRKHQRRDRDGDLVMGATPARSTPPQKSHSANYTELRVTGWTDETEIQRIIHFLERHAAKRSANAANAKGGGVAPSMIKKSRVLGDVLTLSVRPEDVPAFKKINGFSFASAHGKQDLSISGGGISAKSGNDVQSAAASTTVAGGRSQQSQQTSDTFKGFIERRYDANLKLLNLSAIATDEKIREAGLFDSTQRQSKFIPVLMTILEQLLASTDAKKEAIHSITLSNNSLPNLDLVRDISLTLPHIKNLDISGNNFQTTRDIAFWKNKFRNLEHLIVTNNPFVTSQPGWEDEIISWYPRLRLLNTREVRTEDQIAQLDAAKRAPRPSDKNMWLDEGKIAENFLIEFIPGFDNDRNAILQKYYDDTSTFTMSVNTQAKGGIHNEKTPWDAYLPQSRNIKMMPGHRKRFSRKNRGLAQIQKVWSTIPPTRHSNLGSNTYSMDCHPQPGVPDPSGQIPGGVTGLTVTIHGEYEEHRTAKGADEIVRRAFDRIFILGPGANGVRVVNDMLCLRPAGGALAWNPNPKEEAMILQVQQATNLTAEMATDCLKAGNWDLELAAQIFNAQKDNLPPDAFNKQ